MKIEGIGVINKNKALSILTKEGLMRMYALAFA
jgi:hypothetical protein